MSEKMIAALINDIEELANSGDKVESSRLKEVMLPYIDQLIHSGWVRNSIDGHWQ